MRMPGPLVLMLLMLISILKNYAHTSDVSSTINKDKWKTPDGYNQFGQQIFPDKNGCGGDIFVTEDYQYGILTSPNWPGPPPSYVSCVWRLYGISNFFFIVNAFAGLSYSERNMSSGFLTVTNLAMDWEKLFYMGGNELHHATLLNANEQLFEITMSPSESTGNEIKRGGFKLIWWTVPHADFSKIYLSHLWEEANYQDYGEFTVMNKDTIGYVFTTHIRSDTVILKMSAMRANSSLPCFDYNASFSKISFDNGIKSTHQPKCDHFSGETWSTFSVDNSALVGIEITLPKSREMDMRYSFSASESAECPATNSGDKEGVGHIYLGSLESGHEQSKYKPNTQCQDYIPIPPDVQDVFMQIRMQSDIQPSPSCAADYLKIGSQRVCGINGPDTYISSPVDNSLIDRTGTFYVNVARHSAAVDASEPLTEYHGAALPLNADSSLCYVSHVNVSSPYWVLDMTEVFTVVGVRILPEPPSNAIVAVYVKADETDLWPVPSYQTCWRRPMISEMEISRCNPPVSGQFLAIFKNTTNLVLCIVQVFVNIVSPIKAWRNAVSGKKPEIHTEAYAPINTHLLVDGDSQTCINHMFQKGDYLKFILSDDDLTVHAVMLYFQSAGQTVAFQSYGANPWQRGDNIEPDMKSVCVNYDGPTNQHGAILLSCQMPLTTTEFFVTNITNEITLCEVIVYADTKDRAISYAALHKPATKKLLSKGDTLIAPALVDGNLMSCDSTDYAFFLDLLTIHVVEGVNLHIGNQKGSVFVMVWVSPHTAEVIENLSPDSQCKKYMRHDSKHHLHVQHQELKLSLTCSPPKVGRYVIVHISNDTNSVFHLCELQVIAVPYAKSKGFQNAALFKNAWLSPFSATPSAPDPRQFFFYGHGARLTVDGDRGINNTNLTCTTLLSERHTVAWWIVDLANTYEVHTVSLFLCSAHTNATVVINIFPRHSSYPKRCYTGAPVGVLHCSSGITGRFVQLITNEDMCLCEVEVMATQLLSYERFGELPEFINGSLTQMFSFATDDHIQNRGFWASYMINNLRNFTSLVECGDPVRPIKDTLLSPNYPDSYALPGDNYICHWMIPTSQYGVVVVFIDYMNLRVSSGEDKCFHDALIFSNSAGQQITKCGFMKNRSLSIQSFHGDYLHVTLIVRNPKTPVNSVVPERGGFELRFREGLRCTEQLISLTTSRVYHLHDPMHPLAYAPFAWCSWIMDVVNMGTLRIEFKILDLNQVGPECGDDDDDFLTIDSNRYRLRKYCDKGLVHNYTGTELFKPDINMILQTGDTVKFVFKSTEAIYREGFLLHVYYDPYGDKFGYDMDNKQRVFQSRGYPSRYNPENKRITWTFTSRKDSGKFHVKFTDLDLWSNYSAGPGSAHFTVESYLPTSSESRFTFISRTYNDSTKYQDRYSTFEIFPKTVLELTFKPDPKGGKHNVKFQFTVNFERAASTANRSKVFVAEETRTRFQKTSPGLTFSHIKLNENMHVVDNRFVSILEDGIYLIYIRAVSLYGMALENLVLYVNHNRSDFVFVSTFTATGSMSITMKLHIGDVLSVVNTRGLGVDKLSMFTVVYISPFEGGVAYTGRQSRIKDSSMLMEFGHHITLFGFDSSTDEIFYPPKTGIYWISIRLSQHFSSVSTAIDLLRGHKDSFMSMFLIGWKYASASTAQFFSKGRNFSIRRMKGITDNLSFISVVLLAYNRQPYTENHPHIAFFVYTTSDKQYKQSNPTVQFDGVDLYCGDIMPKNKGAIFIPKDGLYLISLTSSSDTSNKVDFLQYLYIKINGDIRFTCISMRVYPMDHTTVLRLKRGDFLTVSTRQNEWVFYGTMLSVAFVQP